MARDDQPPAGLLATVRAAGRPLGSSVLGRVRDRPRLVGLGRWVMDAKWWLLNRVVSNVRMALLLERLVRAGVCTLVVCRHYEGRLLTRGERGTLRRLRGTGEFRLDILPGIDHSLYLRSAREKVVPLLSEHVASLRADPAGGAPPTL